MIALEEKRLRDIISSAVELGIIQGSLISKETRPYLSKRAAYRKYGKAHVDNWIVLGYVKEVKDGENNSKIRLSIIELAKAACSSNRNPASGGNAIQRS